MGDPVIFCTGQFHDQLRARRLVLPAEGLCADHCAALHLFLCALCASLHLRGGLKRPMEQETHHAGLRQLRGGDHTADPDPAENGESGAVASVHTERVKRPDEHASAARIRCGGQPSDSAGTVPACIRSKSLFQFTGYGSHTSTGHHGIFLCRNRRSAGL